MAFNMNTPTYVAPAVATTAVNVTLSNNDVGQNTATIVNMGTTEIFVVSSNSAVAVVTAVFPTSATLGKAGEIIPPTTRSTVKINPTADTFSFIGPTGRTAANCYITTGADTAY